MPQLYAIAAGLLMIFAQQCHSQPPVPLSGKMTLSEEFRPTVYLIQPRNLGELATSFAGIIIDSAQIEKDGSFSFPHLALSQDVTLLEIMVQPAGSRFVNKITDEQPGVANYFPVIIQKGDALRFEANSNQLLVTGRLSPGNTNNKAVQQLIAVRQQAAGQYKPVNDANTGHDASNLLAEADRLAHYRVPLMHFADTTKSFWAAMLAVRWVSPESDYERVPEFLRRQCNRWQKEQPQQAFTRQLCDWCSSGKLPLMIGDTMPDFLLPTSSGDTVHLYSLLGKKLTIIDLWASWCAPCRRENRQVLVPVWQEYREKGVQIVGYALDSDANTWKSAIQKDGAIWPQTSHLMGDTSPFLDMLHITTIPANFILNEHGLIIAKNVHGDAIGETIRKYE